MFRILLAFALALTLTACGALATKPTIAYKTQLVAVNLEDSHFVIPEEPAPTSTREEMKKMDFKALSVTLAQDVAALRGYAKDLIKQIKGIQKANNEVTDRIEKENARVKP